MRARRTLSAAAIAAAAFIDACSFMGPEIIRSGRPAFNDAILATTDEMLLQNIVRLRFGDSIGFLTVSSVTASATLTGSASADVGTGPAANYAGNLVPLRGSISAEQSPTIAFTPVSGDRVLRRLAAETPLDLAVLVVNAANSHKLAWMAMIRTVNDIRNVDFIDPPMLVTDPRFEEIASLIDVLERRGMLRWVELSGGQTGIGMLLHNYAPSGMSEVARLLDLLGLQKIAHEGRDVAIPMRASFGSTQEGTISVETWTLFDLMRWGAASIDLPPGETTAGAIHYPERSALVSKLHILSSSSRPSGSRVTAEYRGRFYYIDQQDELSKQWFSLVGLLASAQVPDTGLSPVLTVPVGKR